MQLTAVDGRRALVVLPNDPELVDILARNGVDISVSEGDQQGNYVALLGNLLFPLVAFGGLFFLFRRAGGGGGAGPMGPMGGPMDFARNKSKFQEVPETGVTFADVAVRLVVFFGSFASCRTLYFYSSAQVLRQVPVERAQLIVLNAVLCAGRGQREVGAAGGRGFPEEPGQVHRAGRQDPQG